MGQADSKVSGYWHTGITVSDMESALRFYRDGLGLEVGYERHREQSDFADSFYGEKIGRTHVVIMRIPGSDSVIELWEYKDRDDTAVAPPQWVPGASHLCLYVEDAEAIHQRVEELGFTSLGGEVMTVPDSDDFAGVKVADLVDADGYVVSIHQPAA